MITRRSLLALSALSLVSSRARADLVQPGETITLRPYTDRAALDLGGPQRNARTSLRLANRGFHIGARIPLETRASTAPFAWNNQVGMGQPAGLYWASREGEEVRVQREETSALGLRPCVLPSGDLLLITRDGVLTQRTLHGEVRARGHALGGTRSGALVLPDGRIVLGTTDRRLVGFDAALRMQFNLPLGAGLVLAPAFLAPDRLVVAAGELLLVLDLEGNILRRTHLRDRAVAAPLIDDEGNVHIVLSQGSVAVFRRGTRGLDRFELGGRSFDGATMLAVDHEGGYRIALPSTGLLALDRTGTERWVRTLDAPFQGTLLVDDEGTTLAFDRRGRMAVVRADGTVEPLLELGGLVSSLPVVERDGLWVVTDAPALVWVAAGAEALEAASEST